MKKIFTFMAAALFAAGASAQIANPVSAKLTWALTDGTTASVATPSGAGEGTLTVGAGLEIIEAAKPFNGINFMAFQATSEDKGDNKYDKAVELEKYIDFTFAPSDQFSMTNVSFDIVKVGTGDPQIFVDIIDGEGVVTHVKDGAAIDIRRNDDTTNPEVDITQTYEVTTPASDKAVTLRIYVGKLANNKQVGLANVVIEGTINGDNLGGDEGGNEGGEEGGDKPTGSYIAWVYTAGYGAYSYDFDADPVVLALKEDYNVVGVSIDASVNPTQDEELNSTLLNADVVVVSEAMAGNNTMSNSLVNYVGQVPVIALKAYNYNSGRWSWGTPANPSPAALGFTANTTYKVLDGVTYEEDGTIQVATETPSNAIQVVTFGEGAPADMVTMGTVGDGAAMYASNAQKFFGIGLSSDCWNYYTANAGIIIKNAAAMLIAGEDLTTVSDTNGISNTIATENASTKAVKVLQNGRLIIKKGEAEFNVSGAQLK